MSMSLVPQGDGLPAIRRNRSLERRTEATLHTLLASGEIRDLAMDIEEQLGAKEFKILARMRQLRQLALTGDPLDDDVADGIYISVMADVDSRRRSRAG